MQSAGSFMVDGLAAAGRGTAKFLLQVFIFLYAVFFFLLSGRETLDRILHLSPLDDHDEQEIVMRFLSVTRATLKGSLLIGGIQGILTGLAFALAGVPGAAFWGTIVGRDVGDPGDRCAGRLGAGRDLAGLDRLTSCRPRC